MRDLTPEMGKLFRLDSPQPASLIDTAFCYISPRPWSCVRVQAGRMLNYFQSKLDKKRAQFLGEIFNFSTF